MFINNFISSVNKSFNKSRISNLNISWPFNTFQIIKYLVCHFVLLSFTLLSSFHLLFCLALICFVYHLFALLFSFHLLFCLALICFVFFRLLFCFSLICFIHSSLASFFLHN